MAFSRTWLQYVCGLLFFVSSISALKFDLEAKHGQHNRCIRNFVAKDTLVVVTATVDGRKGDGMVVNIQVRRPRSRTGLLLRACQLQQVLGNVGRKLTSNYRSRMP